MNDFDIKYCIPECLERFKLDQNCLGEIFDLNGESDLLVVDHLVSSTTSRRCFYVEGSTLEEFVDKYFAKSSCGIHGAILAQLVSFPWDEPILMIYDPRECIEQILDLPRIYILCFDFECGYVNVSLTCEKWLVKVGRDEYLGLDIKGVKVKTLANWISCAKDEYYDFLYEIVTPEDCEDIRKNMVVETNWTLIHSPEEYLVYNKREEDVYSG